jgi:hypothetical protein
MTEVRAATCGFVVVVPSRGRLSDPVINLHEVSVFCKLGYDFSSAHPLSLAGDRCDRHEALLRGSVYPTLDLIESFCEVVDGEVVSKTPAPYVPLSVALTSSIPVGIGLIRGCVGRQLVCGDVFEISVTYCPEGPGMSPAAMKTWRSGLPRLESELATSVGVYSSARASGVLSWKGSESR